jgi:4-hydroxyphenylpyruvate dioxygenase-like putative hemolysin
MGTDGFEFVEYIGPDPQALARLFERIWFAGPPSLEGRESL